ncbi:hypothetical protein Tco_1207577, partial [Tanacetum coccineum]
VIANEDPGNKLSN